MSAGSPVLIISAHGRFAYVVARPASSPLARFVPFPVNSMRAIVRKLDKGSLQPSAPLPA
eukprot:1142836-Pelagomonas_calceolata.AAC.2